MPRQCAIHPSRDLGRLICARRRSSTSVVRSHRSRTPGEAIRTGGVRRPPARRRLRWLVVIADAMVQRSLITIDELKATVGAHAERPGIRRARRVVDLVRMGSESPMESLLRLVLVVRGLDEPVVNGLARDRITVGWRGSTSATRITALASSTRATSTAPTSVSGGATSRGRARCSRRPGRSSWRPQRTSPPGPPDRRDSGRLGNRGPQKCANQPSQRGLTLVRALSADLGVGCGGPAAAG